MSGRTPRRLVEPDPHGLEDRLLARFDRDEDVETVIAFALAEP